MLADLNQEQFQENLKNSSYSLHPIKKQAWQRLQEKGLPHKKSEGFEYLSLEKLKQTIFTPKESLSCCFDQEQIDAAIYPECKSSYIVMVDGKLCLDLSQLHFDIKVLPLKDAYQQFGSYLKGRSQKNINNSQNPFFLLNAAFSNEGVFIYVPKQLQEKIPLQVLHIITGEYALQPKMCIHVGKESSMTLTTSILHLAEGPSWINEHIDVNIEENAHLHFYDSNTSSSKQHFYFSELTGNVKRSGNFQYVYLTNGQALQRKSYLIDLVDENATCSLKGLSCTKDQRQSHIHGEIRHLAPHTFSNQHFKSMLYDQSRFSFEGKIFVDPSALYTEAYQLSNNLLLSDQAVACVKPNLEIFADDVSASHGCTTTQLNQEELFYLLSRGLTHDKAYELLLKAFAREILAEIPLQGVQNAHKSIFAI